MSETYYLPPASADSGESLTRTLPCGCKFFWTGDAAIFCRLHRHQALQAIHEIETRPVTAALDIKVRALEVESSPAPAETVQTTERVPPTERPR